MPTCMVVAAEIRHMNILLLLEEMKLTTEQVLGSVGLLQMRGFIPAKGNSLVLGC